MKNLIEKLTKRIAMTQKLSSLQKIHMYHGPLLGALDICGADESTTEKMIDVYDYLVLEDGIDSYNPAITYEIMLEAILCANNKYGEVTLDTLAKVNDDIKAYLEEEDEPNESYVDPNAHLKAPLLKMLDGVEFESEEYEKIRKYLCSFATRDFAELVSEMVVHTGDLMDLVIVPNYTLDEIEKIAEGGMVIRGSRVTKTDLDNDLDKAVESLLANMGI